MMIQTDTTEPEVKHYHLFQPGRSGNPAGRPPGSRNRSTLAAMALLDGEAEALTRKCVDMALDGDIQALKLCMERILPPVKEQRINVELPPVGNRREAIQFRVAILAAVASGELKPADSLIMMELMKSLVSEIETIDLFPE